MHIGKVSLELWFPGERSYWSVNFGVKALGLGLRFRMWYYRRTSCTVQGPESNDSFTLIYDSPADAMDVRDSDRLRCAHLNSAVPQLQGRMLD